MSLTYCELQTEFAHSPYTSYVRCSITLS